MTIKELIAALDERYGADDLWTGRAISLLEALDGTGVDPTSAVYVHPSSRIVPSSEVIDDPRNFQFADRAEAAAFLADRAARRANREARLNTLNRA